MVKQYADVFLCFVHHGERATAMIIFQMIYHINWTFTKQFNVDMSILNQKFQRVLDCFAGFYMAYMSSIEPKNLIN